MLKESLETYIAVREGEREAVTICHDDELLVLREFCESLRRMVSTLELHPMINKEMIAAKGDIIEGIENGISNSAIGMYLTPAEALEIERDKR